MGYIKRPQNAIVVKKDILYRGRKTIRPQRRYQ